MITRKALPRRTILRGLGTAIALPVLDAMTPALASSQLPGKTPIRMAFVYVPNGIDMRHWNPDYEGKLQELPRILKPLEPFKNDITLLGNLTHNNGRALLDGPGDHGRCCASYLTGVQPRKTMVDIKAGISCDQIVANKIGHLTRFASLEVGLEDARQAGDCDSGYSCAYTNNLAWRSETQPLPPILDPRALFERLFGSGPVLSPEARARQTRFRRSILDFVSGDTKKLQSDLGPTDRRKLDEYLSSIREIERQLEKAENDNAQIDPGMEKPYGVPADFAEHFRLMTDMITVAFQADLTRVVTFLVTREGTSRPYREIGIPDGHHPLTHHKNDPEMMEKVAQINCYHMEQFAKWIGKLKAIEEGDSNILNNSMIVYGAGLADGNRHTHEDLPTLIAGRGGNYIRPGRRIVYRKETPMSNLFLSMMDCMGVHVEHFGDASGRLDGLTLS
jgi:Alkyl hydroperoxide reductase, large subunit